MRVLHVSGEGAERADAGIGAMEEWEDFVQGIVGREGGDQRW